MKSNITFFQKTAFNNRLFFMLIYLTGLVSLNTFAINEPNENNKKNPGSIETFQCNLKVNIKGTKSINCTNPTTILTASTNTTGVTFSWTGPGGFTSNIVSPTISVGGLYKVVITNPANGCTASDTATVNANFTKPQVSATGGTITCANPNVTLNASSPNANVTFSWVGPGGFTSNIPNPTTSVPGVYTVTGTRPGNGCSTTITVNVLLNTTPPAVAVSGGGTLTCVITTVSILGSSSTPGVSYAWTGPGGFTSSASSITVALPGIYSLTVTNPVNGCKSVASIVINQNIAAPPITATGATITCSTAPVIIVAQSPLPTVAYSWIGPGGFTSTLPNPVVTLPGNYIVTATNSANGCVSKDTVIVNQNITSPNVNITGRKRINCATPTTVLTAHSSVPGSIFSWTGPGGFTSNIANPTISAGGLYKVVATDPINGCSGFDTAFVNQNFNKPKVTGTGGTITCTTPTVTLNASSPNANVTFAWTGPGGFTSNIPNPTVSLPGIYTVTGTNTNNGCINTDTAVVKADTLKPSVAIQGGGTLTCTILSVALSASSSTPGVTYAWVGPGGFTSNASSVKVAAPGTYTVTVTNPINGCSGSASTIVLQNITAPPITATGATITCSTAPVIIAAQSPLPIIAYSWIGPGGFTSTLPNPVVTIPGSYTVVATNPVNGCTSSATVSVNVNTTPPNINITGRKRINCANPTTVLTAHSAAVGAIFNWTGPGGFTSNIANPTISVAGLYTVVATDPANGCTASDTAFVNQNFNTPRVNATGGAITCANPTVMLNANSPNVNVTFSWTGPGGFTSNIPNPVVSLPGFYFVIGTNTNNGCATQVIVQVVDNRVLPVCSIIAPTLTPSAGSVQNIVAGSAPNLTYSWSLLSSSTQWGIIGSPSNSSVQVQVGPATTQGILTLVVTNTLTACKQTCQITLSAVTPFTGSYGEQVNSDVYTLKHANPMTEFSTLTFSPNANYKVKMDLYSFMGIKVATLLDGTTKANETYNFMFNNTDLTSGTYLLRIIIENKIYQKRILINKY